MKRNSLTSFKSFIYIYSWTYKDEQDTCISNFQNWNTSQGRALVPGFGKNTYFVKSLLILYIFLSIVLYKIKFKYSKTRAKFVAKATTGLPF